MGSFMVAPKGISFGHLLDPFTHDYLSFPQAVEDLPIQKVISKGAIKAFTKAILPRTTGGDVSGFHSNAG